MKFDTIWHSILPLAVLNHNTTKSYLKYKAYNDTKTKASPLETTDYGYNLNLKADTQATKIPFREFNWQGPYKVEKFFLTITVQLEDLGPIKHNYCIAFVRGRPSRKRP